MGSLVLNFPPVSSSAGGLELVVQGFGSVGQKSKVRIFLVLLAFSENALHSLDHSFSRPI